MSELFIFFLQPSYPCNVICVTFNIATNSGNSLGMVHLGFALSVIGTYCLHFFVGKTEGADVLVLGSHSSVHTCEDNASTACLWAALTKTFFVDFFQKSRYGRMKLLAKKVHRQGMTTGVYYWLTK